MSSQDSRGRPPTTFHSAMSHYPSQAGPSKQVKPMNMPFGPSGGMLPSLEASPSWGQRSQMKQQQGAQAKGVHSPAYLLAPQATSPTIFGPNQYLEQSIHRELVDSPDSYLPTQFNPYRPTQQGVSHVTHYPERPPERPPIQPHTLADPVPRIPIDTVEQRINAFDQDTQKVINTYGGYPMNNTIKVLEKVEKWRLGHEGPPLSVYRKGNAKGGVDHVICNVCRAFPPPPGAKGDASKDKSRFASIQKAAEHLTSFHWELPIWQCREDDCGRSFRRKQECDRHEESAHGRIAPKKIARIAKARQPEEQSSPENGHPPPSPKKKSTRNSTVVKTKRHGQHAPINASVSADNLLVTPVEQRTVGPTRSRSPSRVRDGPYAGKDMKRVHSTPAFREVDVQSANFGMSMTTVHQHVIHSPEMAGSPDHLGQLRTPRIVVTDHGNIKAENSPQHRAQQVSNSGPSTLGHFDPAQPLRYPAPLSPVQYVPSSSRHDSAMPVTAQRLPVPNYHNSIDGVADGGNPQFPLDTDAWLSFLDSMS